MRPGCDRDAAARLTYDPVGCQVWLEDLADRVGRSQEICALHAERLTVPRGWVLSDQRSDEPTMFVTPTAAPAAVAPGPVVAPASRRRRSTGRKHPAAQTIELFEVLRQELADAEAETLAAAETLAEAEPEPEPESQPEPESRPQEPATAVEDDELPEALRATSPLLSRAFAATGHQRSVLTQRAPDEDD